MSHNHEQDHGHHDHNHYHHHHSHADTIERAWACVDFEAHTHEQAATVSMSVHPNAGCERTFSNVVEIMQIIACAAEEAGGIVGHIKAFAKQDETTAHASVTAADLSPTCEGDQSLALDGTTDIQLVAIVLLIGEEDLLAICKDALA